MNSSETTAVAGNDTSAVVDNSTYPIGFCPVFEDAASGGGGGGGGGGGVGGGDGGGGTGSGSSVDYNLLFEFIAYGVLLNVVGVLGILGNVISMIILSRPQMKSSINYLLIGLARCDTVLIVTSIILFGLPVIYPSTDYLFNYYFKVYPLVAPVVYPIAMISQTVSVYLTLTVTLERFVAVCHPLQARSLCTYGRARAYVVAIIVFAVLYNITRFWEVRVQKCMHTGYKQYVYQVYPSELRNDKDYISIYIHWMYLVIMYFIPFGSLAVLNAAIYNQVRLANRERQRLSRLQKKEIGLATMLLCVVVVFLLCNVWALISNVAEAFYGITVDQLVKVSNLLVTINSSVNFVIYVIFGEKFKRLFFKLFFPRGVWMCGWHPADGHGGPGGCGHDHDGRMMDESEATCANGATFECRQLSGGGVGGDRFKRCRSQCHHHGRHHNAGQRNQQHNNHHNHHHHHHKTPADGFCTSAGSGVATGSNSHRNRNECSSGISWEPTTTVTNVHQI